MKHKCTINPRPTLGRDFLRYRFQLQLLLIVIFVHWSCFSLLHHQVEGRILGIPQDDVKMNRSERKMQDTRQQQEQNNRPSMKLNHRKLVQSDNGNGINDQYIVIFNENFTSTLVDTTMTIKDKILQLFTNANNNVNPIIDDLQQSNSSNNNSSGSSLVKDWIVNVLFRNNDDGDDQHDDTKRRQTSNIVDTASTDYDDDEQYDNMFVKILHIFNETSFQGFVVSNLRFPRLLAYVLDDFDIAYVEQDIKIEIDRPVNEGNENEFSSASLNVPWGLDRIDQVTLPLDNQEFVDNIYTGSGVMVYILDSGILPTHNEFNGRIICGPNFLSSDSDTSTSGNLTSDGCDDGTSAGHATHVAGVVGGQNYGVAKEVTIVSIKVLDADGNGYMSNVIAAIQYVINQKMKNPSTPVILNMSLGGSINLSLNKIISTGANDYNIHFIVSAGNNYRNACRQSPAMSDDAITVGATNRRDDMSLFSNWGKCVDILAPGTDIQSAWNTDITASKIISGTSMAAPFVAGVAALYLQRNTSLSSSDLKEALRGDAAKNIIDLPLWAAFTTPNYLLNTDALFSVQS